MLNKIIRKVLQYNEARLPEILPYKYEAMQENPFRFFRATNHLFYELLVRDGKLPTSPDVWLCGDMHLENFGSFRGRNNLVYFDLNDFDDAALGPVLFELARMCTGIYVAFEALQIGQDKARHMASLFLKSYSTTILSRQPDHVEERTASGIVCHFLERAAAHKKKEIIRKRTLRGKELDPGHPKQLPLTADKKTKVEQYITGWLKQDSNSPYNYDVLDSVFRLAGTSSLGLERYTFLLRSANETGDRFLLMDMKECTSSAMGPYVDARQPKWETEAMRVASIQQLLQDRSPALLSTGMFQGKPFIMQEMQPVKDNINFGLLKNRYRDMCAVIDTMGMLAGSAHLRGAGHYKAATGDRLVAFCRRQDWQDLLLKLSEGYAGVTMDQYRAFRELKTSKVGS